ncbi:hypothetical protein BTJ68_12609 [Hortaea werneckii EXF-2000]|uniref:Uncharacterized protein n=1 Tax=Hortaea werneckii EXF-2000 TaxID=1157616 RepID=A0A1Z5STL8_HORWE|nr:hypothetical protein BTJ68_12609 [Hortaea werneckii EXF-2000]
MRLYFLPDIDRPGCLLGQSGALQAISVELKLDQTFRRTIRLVMHRNHIAEDDNVGPNEKKHCLKVLIIGQRDVQAGLSGHVQ